MLKHYAASIDVEQCSASIRSEINVPYLNILTYFYTYALLFASPERGGGFGLGLRFVGGGKARWEQKIMLIK